MEKSRYNQFKEKAFQNIDAYREEIKGNGSFEYRDQVESLIKLEHNLNSNLLNYLFGSDLDDDKRLVNHLADKFLSGKRSLLHFLQSIDSEMRFFILHELKTNKYFFVNT